MKALSSIIFVSLSIAAASAHAREPLPVETVGRTGPSAAANAVGTPIVTQASRHLNVAQVIGRGQPVVPGVSSGGAPRTGLADAMVAKRFGRV